MHVYLVLKAFANKSHIVSIKFRYTKAKGLTCQGRSVSLKGFAHTKNVLNAEGALNQGVGGHAPQKILKFRFSEKPFRQFPKDIPLNKSEEKCSIYMFIICRLLVLGKIQHKPRVYKKRKGVVQLSLQLLPNLSGRRLKKENLKVSRHGKSLKNPANHSQIRMCVHYVIHSAYTRVTFFRK